MELLVLFLSLLAAVAWTELKEWLPWFARRLILWGVSALPLEERDRMREELLAEVAAVPGKISPFVFACSLCWGFWRPVFMVKLDASASRYLIRATDLALVSLLLIFLAPLMAYLAIRLRSSGRASAIYFKWGLTKNNKKFRHLVFRTRDAHAKKLSRLGRFLVKTGLHKLPTLFCVLFGDMSFVGPPPRFPNGNLDHHVHLKPGLVWFSNGAHDVQGRFGRSTLSTLRDYVALLWNGMAEILTTIYSRK